MMSSIPAPPESAKSGARQLAQISEAEHVQAVIDGDHHHVAGVGEIGAVDNGR